MAKKKPSEEMSIIPESMRDAWAGRVSKDDKAGLDSLVEEARPKMRSESTQMERARRELEDAHKDSMPSWNPIKNISDLVTGKAEEQASRLSRANENFSRTEAETGGYAKGGMVRKYKTGGLVVARGHGKARTKPCRMC